MEAEQKIEAEQKMETEQKQKKKNRSFDIFLAILIVGVIIGGYFYSQSLVKPVVNVNGTELTVNMTVQELIDAGFAVDDSMFDKGDMDLDMQPDIPGESYTSTFYYLYAPDQYGGYEYVNVVFQVFNKDVNSTEFKNSQIYSYQYDPSFTFSKATVLINDIDFTNVTKEDAIAAFEELGVKFDAADKEEFMSGERNIIFGKSGDYSYVIETDYTDGTVTNIEVKRNV